MKNDNNGCSTCPKGEERYERNSYFRRGRTETYYEYDYRHTSGALFTCVKPSLEECRAARDRAIANGTLS